MLKQVFGPTDPLAYTQTPAAYINSGGAYPGDGTDAWPGSSEGLALPFGGIFWWELAYQTKYPYTDILYGLDGLWTAPVPTATSPGSIFLYTELRTDWFEYFTGAIWQWDGATGALIPALKADGTPQVNGGGVECKYMPFQRSAFSPLVRAVKSRLGQLYWVQQSVIGEDRLLFPFTLPSFNPGSTAAYDAADYGGLSGGLCNFPWIYPLIDESEDKVLNSISNQLLIFNLTAKTQINFPWYFPDTILQVVTAEYGQAYVLCANGIVVLVDYRFNRVLGAARVTTDPITGSSINIAWDSIYKRLLVCQQVADNSDGSSATVIKGFNMIPVADRLAKPIPLAKLRTGKEVPVMVQLVDDRNEGCNAAHIDATATGPVILDTHIPVTGPMGEAVLKATCTGTGGIEIDCNATV